MVADLGLQGLPSDPGRTEWVEHYRTVLEMLPPQFSKTPRDVIREMERMIDVGVSHFQAALQDMATPRRFIDEVVPNVRLEGRS